MAILVIGGTGTIGSLVVEQLLERGEKVQVLTRSADKAATIAPGVEAVVGSLADPPSLARLFSGVEKVMLVTAIHPDEAVHGQNAVRAAKKAGVRKIVYSGVILPPDSLHIPHFASKLPIEKAIKESGIVYTILRPSAFFQNDLWFKDVMLQYGFYPQPLGSAGVNRVDARDIAGAAISALLESGHDGKTVNICGAESVTGKSVARGWTEAIGTEINYMGDDLDQWAQAASNSMPAWLVHDLRIMYDYFQRAGLHAAPQDRVESDKLTHHAPRAFADFARKTAEVWRSTKSNSAGSEDNHS